MVACLDYKWGTALFVRNSQMSDLWSLVFDTSRKAVHYVRNFKWDIYSRLS